MIRFEVDPIKKGYQVLIEKEQLSWVEIKLRSIRTSHREEKGIVWSERPMSVVWNKFYTFPSYLKSGIYEIMLQDEEGNCLAKYEHYMGEKYELLYEVKTYDKKWKQLSVRSPFALEAKELYFLYNNKRIPLPAMEWDDTIRNYTIDMIFQERETLKQYDMSLCEQLRQYHFLTWKCVRKW